MAEEESTVQKDSGNISLDITLQDIVDSVEDELLVIDTDYRIRFANSAVRNGLQKKADLLNDSLCYKLIHDRDKPCAAPLWDCPLRSVLDSGSMITAIHPDHILGNDKIVKITAYPLRDSRGNIIAMVELRRDVTAERELETQILRRHHQLLALSHISKATSGQLDLDAALRIALDNVLEIINGTVGGILLLDEKTNTLSYRVHRGLSAKYTENVHVSIGEGITGKVAKTGEPILLEDISSDPRNIYPDLISAEGLKGFASIPLKTRNKVVGVMNIASHKESRFSADDISLLNSIGDYLGATIEQTRLYEHVARVGERNRNLLRYALTAQEEERKRIARELHDETSQALTSLTLSLQAIMMLAQIKGIGDADFMEKVKGTYSFAVQAGHDVVRLMKDLRPTLLDELGMASAIRRYAKSSLEPKGINVSTEFVGTDRRFPPEVEVSLLRIAQGSIGNVLEHAQAKNVSVKLKCTDKECVMVIQDDGKGFDVSKLTQVEASGRGAGLFIMRERTSMLGGVGYVESTPGQGTKVTVKVPISTQMLDEENQNINS